MFRSNGEFTRQVLLNELCGLALEMPTQRENRRFSRWRGGRVPEPENMVFEMARRESSRAGKILTNIDRIKEIRDGR